MTRIVALAFLPLPRAASGAFEGTGHPCWGEKCVGMGLFEFCKESEC